MDFQERLLVLVGVGTLINFKSAEVLIFKSASNKWAVGIACWEELYVGYPSKLKFIR